MKPALITIATVGLLVAAAQANQAKSKPKTDKEALQGDWTPVAMETDGRPFSGEELKKYAKPMTINGDKLTIVKEDQTKTDTAFKLEPTKKPKQIDLVLADGPAKGKSIYGIYELDGDKLKLSVAPPAGERPKDFTTAFQDGRILTSYQRARK